MPVPYGPAAAVFVIDTSAIGMMVVVAVELLLPGVGSVDTDVTVAVFDTLPDAGAFTLSVNTLAPNGTDASVHVMVPAEFVHDQPGAGVSEANVVPAGIASVSVAAIAGFGPLFVTVIV